MSVISPNQDAPPKQVLRIVYADDMRELRAVVQMVLSRDGHSIECVASADPLLDKLKADPKAFDLVITDHYMPDIDGLELVRRLRAMKYPGMIIVLTSDISWEVDAAYKALKVDAILGKPVYPNVLREAIAALPLARD